MTRLGPRALFAAAVLAVPVLITAIVMTVLQRHEACETAVDVRRDQRAMWLYALDQNPNPLDPLAVSFRVALDDLIPELECPGWWSSEPQPVGD